MNNKSSQLTSFGDFQHGQNDYGNMQVSGGYAVQGNVYHNHVALQPDPTEVMRRR